MSIILDDEGLPKYMNTPTCLAVQELISNRSGTIETCKMVIREWNIRHLDDEIIYAGETFCNIYLTGWCVNQSEFIETYKYFKPMDGTGVHFVDMREKS